MERDKEIDYGNASSSKQPRWDIVPRRALLRLIKRFEMGVERKGDKAWNARTQNQDCLINHEFVVSRIVHVINHAYALLDKMEGRIPDDGDDDAGAIAWGGIFLCEATDAARAARINTQDHLKHNTQDHLKHTQDVPNIIQNEFSGEICTCVVPHLTYFMYHTDLFGRWKCALCGRLVLTDGNTNSQ